MSDVVLYEAKNHIARITINRPEARNAISPEVTTLLRASLARVKEDTDVRAVVLRGAGGRAFSAGADLGGGMFQQDESFLDKHEGRGVFAELFTTMNGLGKPVIAAVEGYCLAGGFGLALACDFIIATDDASFGTPEIKRGLVPMIIMATIVRNLGRKKALELILTGDRIDAAEAHRIGLVNHVVPKDQFDARIDEMAGKLAALSPAIMKLAKDAFYRSQDMTFEDALDYLKSQLTINTMAEDVVEGITAFMEKRDPVWKGR
ncbi:MAG: enoyl-CoA hydratase/isomerase family protein [Myxococcota bacterium]